MKKSSRRRTHGAASAAAVAVGIALTMLTATVRADEATDAYCARVSSRAESDADLLLAPTVTGQVLRYPSEDVDSVSGAAVGQGWQPRVSMSYGLVDAYKGVGILAVGKTSCVVERHAAQLRAFVDARADIGRPAALVTELAVLRARRPEIEALALRSEERVKRGIGTVMEVLEIRRRQVDLDRTAVHLEGELTMLKARRVPTVSPSREQLALALRELEASARTQEDSISHVRDLDPWRLNLTGGAVTRPVVDYFAVVEVSYALGGIGRSGAESRYREARASERKTERSELQVQVALALQEIAESQRQARQEIVLLDAQTARLAALQASLAGPDAPDTAEIRASSLLDSIAIDAERAYLSALVEQRHVMEDPHATN